MSEAAISQFFEHLKKDKALVNEYNSAVASAMRSVVWPAMVDVAAGHGYEFTREELGRYLESNAGELSQQELESISAAGPSGTMGTLTKNPWVLAQIVASAIAIPVALDDGDDDSASP
jgi:hypothetical protein